jgi:hypothetical protein
MIALSMVATQKSNLTKHYSKIMYVPGGDLDSPQVQAAIEKFLTKATTNYQKINKISNSVNKIVYIDTCDSAGTIESHLPSIAESDPHASYHVFSVKDSNTRFNTYNGVKPNGDINFAPLIVGTEKKELSFYLVNKIDFRPVFVR